MGARQFPALGVQVAGGNVYTIAPVPRLLGPLAGAQAAVLATGQAVKGGKHHWMAGAAATVLTGGLAAPIAVPAGLRKTRTKVTGHAAARAAGAPRRRGVAGAMDCCNGNSWALGHADSPQVRSLPWLFRRMVPGMDASGRPAH